jgi:hypothetical protein
LLSAPIPPALYQTITFTRPGNTSDLRYRAQGSTNLAAWADTPVLVSREWSAVTGAETVIYRSPTPYSAGQRAYMRILVETIP